ncbi:StAR-related lipid transfer protein [Plasmodium gaboni]|uniref:StAR-related lipid transfer protein n=1 Tax=Plasmodium gaboni TaxID=647221 RepID=A0ABY1UHK1_9APIC|nr:StAR-related lipid transfer protein [Plasmodium gaboni]
MSLRRRKFILLSFVFFVVELVVGYDNIINNYRNISREVVYNKNVVINKKLDNNIYKNKINSRILKENKEESLEAAAFNEKTKEDVKESCNYHTSSSVFNNDKENTSSFIKTGESYEGNNIQGQAQAQAQVEGSIENASLNLRTKNGTLINDEMLDYYLNFCDQVNNKTFPFNECTKLHTSDMVTLCKNNNDEKSKITYDLLGYGEMDDVSAYSLSYALNDVETIKDWNKNIYKLNYLNLKKSDIQEKIDKNEKINVNKFILQNEKDVPEDERKYLYLINGLPWPFKSQDTIYEVYQKYYNKKNMLLIINKSLNDVFDNNSSYARINNYENFFCIYPKSKNSYDKGVKYVMSIIYDVNIPKFIQNNILNQIFPDLIFNLHNTSIAITDKTVGTVVDLSKSEQNAWHVHSLKDVKPSDTPIVENIPTEQENSYGMGFIKMIFVDGPYNFWIINVNFFKKIFGLFFNTQ